MILTCDDHALGFHIRHLTPVLSANDTLQMPRTIALGVGGKSQSTNRKDGEMFDVRRLRRHAASLG